MIIAFSLINLDIKKVKRGCYLLSFLVLDLDGVLLVLELLVEVSDLIVDGGSKGSDNSARATDDLAGLTSAVDLAETAPLTELVAGGDTDDGEVTGSAESLDELDVGLLVAVSGKEAEDGITAVKSLDALVETTGETVLGEGDLEDTADGSGEVEGSGDGSGGSLNGGGGSFDGGSGGFRHF